MSPQQLLAWQFAGGGQEVIFFKKKRDYMQIVTGTWCAAVLHAEILSAACTKCSQESVDHTLRSAVLS